MSLSEQLPIRGDEPRILIVRLSKVTDLVLATSLLQALRERWPRAYIAWLAQTRPATLLDGDPRLNALIRVPNEVFQRPGPAYYLRRELGEHRFDWVIDAQDDRRSRLVARLVPKAIRIGFDSDQGKAFMFRHRLPRERDRLVIAHEYRKLAEAITGDIAPAPLLPVSEAPRRAVQSMMRNTGLQPGFVALCPYSLSGAADWSNEHWLRLAHKLREELSLRCVLMGATNHRERAEKLMERMPGDCVNLVGQVRLLNAPAWMQQARAVIGVDTSLTHIAVGVHTPTVVIFADAMYRHGADSPLEVVTLSRSSLDAARTDLSGAQPPSSETGEPSSERPLTAAQVMRRLRRLLQLPS